MAKGNKKSRNEVLEKEFIDNFDKTIRIFEDLADNCDTIMPLAADSCRLTVKIIKTYKQAFKKGLPTLDFSKQG